MMECSLTLQKLVQPNRLVRSESWKCFSFPLPGRCKISKAMGPLYGSIYGTVYRNVLPRGDGDVSYRYRGDFNFVGQQRDIGCEPPFYCFPRPF